MAIKEMRVQLVSWAYRRKQEVMYLQIDDIMLKKYGELLNRAPDEEFFGMVEKHVTAYMENGTMPPAQIAPAIFNAVDDIRAGRPIALRSGDYIALQGYYKSK